MAGNIKKLMAKSLLGVAMLLGAGNAFADYQLNMTEGVTEMSREIYDLHMLVLWICTIVGIGVFAVFFYSIFKHRKSKGAVAASFHENTTVEVIWTAIPLAILVAIAVPATKTLLAYEDTSNSEITIKVTGWQWKWQYEYINEGVSFFSSLDAESNKTRELGSSMRPADVENYLLNVDNEVVVPVGKKIRFLFTANDVLHAWWVPDLAVKRDAIPGFINESWTKIDKPGVYRGQCAELCGKDHGFMPIVVRAVSEEEYGKWVASQKAAAAESVAASSKSYSKAELMAMGEKVYGMSCAGCHGATGDGIPGVFPPMKGSAVATTGPVGAHIDIVVKGKGGMPPFGAQLSDADVAAIVTYERNGFGNNTGDVVQPSDVAAHR